MILSVRTPHTQGGTASLAPCVCHHRKEHTINTTLKRGLQMLGTVAILGTSACVVDPNFSGVGYGSYDGYDYDNSYTTTTRVIGNGSNFAMSTGFLVGNYYYYDDNYYPINYYTSGGTRYYRPMFDRPYRIHPDARYRNLNRNQLDQWRRHQSIRYDPSYRPHQWNNHNRDRWNNRDKDRWNNDRWGNRDQDRWGNNRPVITRPTPSTRPQGQVTRPIPSTRPQDQTTRPTPSTRPQVRSPLTGNVIRPTPQQPRPNVTPNRPQTQVTRPQAQQTRPSVPSVRPTIGNTTRPVVQNPRPRIDARSAATQNSRSQMQNQSRFGSMDNRRLRER